MLEPATRNFLAVHDAEGKLVVCVEVIGSYIWEDRESFNNLEREFHTIGSIVSLAQRALWNGNVLQ